jgi:transmembrane sensor
VIRSNGSEQIDWNQLAAWFAGELPPEAAGTLDAWVRAEPGRAEEVARLRALWQAAEHAAPEWDAESALVTVRQTARDRGLLPSLHGRRRVSGEQRRFHLPSNGWWVTGATAALVALAVSGLWYFSGPSAPLVPAEQVAEMVTPRGQRAELTLPDGSHVILGPGSRLRYSTNQFNTRRDLHLEGEAYFEVVHDDTRPMRVFSARGVTEDLGTAFAVMDHREGALQVVVAEGRVVMRRVRDGDTAATGDSLVLGARDVGQLRADGGIVARRNVDVDSYLAWRDGRLIFRNTPLREVLFRLSTWYDIDVELGDSALATRPFTASFPRHETSDQVLRTLTLALGLRVERRGALVLVLPGATGGQP